jgi:hypothetical protein
MSKHVDLIAVGFLLFAFACAARLHELAPIRVAQARVFRALPVSPIFVAPPRLPRTPRLPHLPNV